MEELPYEIREIFKNEILTFFQEEEARNFEGSALNILVRQGPKNDRLIFTIKAKGDYTKIRHVIPRGNSIYEINNYLFAKKKTAYEVELGLYDSVLEKIAALSELKDLRIVELNTDMIESLDRNFFWSKMKRNG